LNANQISNALLVVSFFADAVFQKRENSLTISRKTEHARALKLICHSQRANEVDSLIS
jgi:hypothetical protein